MTFILGLILAAALALIPANIAKSKGKDFTTWYIYGFLLWIVAVIHAAALPSPPVIIQAPQSGPAPGAAAEKVADTELMTYDLNSPIDITGYSVSTDGDRAYISVSVRNSSRSQLIALKLRAEGTNNFDEKINVGEDGVFELIIQDLHLAPGLTVTSGIVPLPDRDIRKVSLSVKQARFSDGSTLESEGPEMVVTTLQPIDEQMVYHLRQKLSRATYYPQQKEGHWFCTCGSPNRDQQDRCRFCDAPKELVFQTSDIIEARHAELKEIQERESRERMERMRAAEELAEKRKKTVTIVLAALVLIIAVAGSGMYFLPPYLKYQKALSYLEKGIYWEAQDLFLELDDYKDSSEQVKETYYQLALNLFEEENYERASYYFEKVPNYKESAAYNDTCKLEMEQLNN